MATPTVERGQGRGRERERERELTRPGNKLPRCLRWDIFSIFLSVHRFDIAIDRACSRQRWIARSFARVKAETDRIEDPRRDGDYAWPFGYLFLLWRN